MAVRYKTPDRYSREQPTLDGINRTDLFTGTHSLTLILFDAFGGRPIAVTGQTVAEIFDAHPHSGRAVLVYNTGRGQDHRSPVDNYQWSEPGVVRQWERIGEGPIREFL